MRNLWIGLAASASLWLGSQATAAPLTATYEGVLLDTQTPFRATFFYDDDKFVNGIVPNYYDGTGHEQYAKFFLTSNQGANIPETEIDFDSSDYFYAHITNGIKPLYEFGIRSTEGESLYLKFSGGAEEGEYDLPGSDTVLLDPQSVLIKAGPVSPVPLPRSLGLFASALLCCGVATIARKRRVGTIAL